MTRCSLPLLSTQRGVRLAERLAGDSRAFQTGRYLDIPTTVRPDRFRHAVTAAVDRHELLRTVLVEADGETRQQVLPLPVWSPAVRDLRDEPDARDRALALMRADLSAPRTPERAAVDLVSEMLFLLPGDRSLWYQRLHHVLTDGYGHSLLFAQLLGACAGRPLPEAPTLAELVDAEAAELPAAGSDLRHWLASPPVPARSLGVEEATPRPAATHIRVQRDLPVRATALLNHLARRCQTTWAAAVAAAAADLVASFTDSTTAVLGLPLMRRGDRVWRRTIAPRVTVMPMRVNIDPQADVRRTLREVEKRLHDASAHQHAISEDLRAAASLPPSERLIGPQLNLKPFHDDPRVHGMTARMVDLSAGPVEDLTISVYPDGERLHLDVDGNPRLRSPEELDDLADRLLLRLERLAVAGPRDRFTAAGWLLPKERDRVRVRRARADHPLPTDDAGRPLTVPAITDRTVRRQPRRLALIAPGCMLTREELAREASGLSALLRDRGLRPGMTVGVCLHRGASLVAAVLAVLRSGLVYLPLDPDAPAERIRMMLADASASAVVTTPDTVGLLPEDAPVILLDAAAAPLAEPTPPRPVASGPDADDPAYLLFTSGSTGRPKGVVVHHIALANRLLWMADALRIGPGDRVLHKTPIGFDVSLWELLLPPVAGAVTVIAPPGAQRDPFALGELIEREQVTVVHFVPTMLRTFVSALQRSARRPDLSSLRLIVCSGETLTGDVVTAAHALTDARIVNLYGPTEAAIDVTAHVAARHVVDPDIPIGLPVWNTTTEVRDPAGRLLPDGVTGELCLGGIQLAEGYRGRPEETDRAFVRMEDHPDGPAREYRTGDRAVRDRAGLLRYRGRRDGQVKLHGQRLELGEVERAMSLPAAPETAATVHDHAGDRILVGYVVGGQAAADAARRHCRRTLPNALVPTVVLPLPELPLSPSGKLDRRALPAPELQGRGALPRTDLERRVLAAFRRVLADPQADEAQTGLGMTDDFFTHGGSSLSAVELVVQLEEEGVHADYADIFAASTPQALAALIDADRRDAGFAPVLDLTPAGRAPALDDEDRVWAFVHPAGGLAWCYRTLAGLLPGRVLGLQSGVWESGVAADDVDQVARRMTDGLLRAAPTGRLHVIGWSVGGVIAHRLVTRLEELGRRPVLLGLLDAYPPSVWRAAPVPPQDPVMALTRMAGIEPRALLESPEHATLPDVARALAERGHPLGELDARHLRGLRDAVAAGNRLMRSARLPQTATPTVFVGAGDGAEWLDPRPWRAVCRGPWQQRELPIRHEQLVTEAWAPAVADILMRAGDVRR